MNSNPNYAPTPESLYRAFRRQMDTALEQPFFQGKNDAVSEVTLFAILVYIVCGSNAHSNETITALYRLFLHDVAGRESDNQTATYYQTILNQTITKFSEVPLSGGVTPAIQKLSEMSVNIIGLSTAQIPFMYGFMQKALSYPYHTEMPAANVPLSQPSAQPAPTQPATPVPSAPAYGSTAPTPQPAPPVAPQPTTPAYGQAPMQPQVPPVYTQLGGAQQVQPPMQQPTPGQPQAQPLYTQPQGVPPMQPTYAQANTPPAYGQAGTPATPGYTTPSSLGALSQEEVKLASLNKISGWLLAVIILHAFSVAYNAWNIFSYYNYGYNSSFILFSLVIPVLTLIFIVLVLLKNKFARYVYVVFYAFLLYYHFPTAGVANFLYEVGYAFAFTLPMFITLVYLFVSKRVKAVLGPIFPKKK